VLQTSIRSKSRDRALIRRSALIQRPTLEHALTTWLCIWATRTVQKFGDRGRENERQAEDRPNQVLEVYVRSTAPIVTEVEAPGSSFMAMEACKTHSSINLEVNYGSASKYLKHVAAISQNL